MSINWKQRIINALNTASNAMSEAGITDKPINDLNIIMYPESKPHTLESPESAKQYTIASGGVSGSKIDLLRMWFKNKKFILDKPKNNETLDEFTDRTTKFKYTGLSNGKQVLNKEYAQEELGSVPKNDFVDALFTDIVPLEEFGVKKVDSTIYEKSLREYIKNYGKMRAYQIGDSELDDGLIDKLDSKLKTTGPIKTIGAYAESTDDQFPIKNGVYYDTHGFSRIVVSDGNKRYYKNIDVFKVDPSKWNFKIPTISKKLLQKIHSQSSPYIVVTPWKEVPKNSNSIWDYERLFPNGSDPKTKEVYLEPYYIFKTGGILKAQPGTVLPTIPSVLSNAYNKLEETLTPIKKWEDKYKVKAKASSGLLALLNPEAFVGIDIATLTPQHRGVKLAEEVLPIKQVPVTNPIERIEAARKARIPKPVSKSEKGLYTYVKNHHKEDIEHWPDYMDEFIKYWRR